MHIDSRRTRTMVALLLCAALFHTATASPLRTYAVVEEYDDEDGQADWDDDEEVEPDLPAASSSGSSNNDAAINQINNQITQVTENLKSIQEQQKKIEADISSARTEKEKAEAARNTVGNQISLREQEILGLEQRIAALEEQITLLEENIDEKQDEIVQKQGEIDYNYDLFKKRLRAKYMQDNGTTLGLLLGADSFSDFLTRTEYMNRVAQHDRDLMELLTEERIAIEDAKADLEDDKAKVEDNKASVLDDKAEVEVKKQELAVQYQQASQEVQDIARMEQEYLADLQKNKAMQDKMKADMDALFKQLESIKTPYAGGSMAWPLPGYRTISSRFGSRFGGSDNHTGIDITGTGCRGANIVAANDGVVSKVNWAYKEGVGYGIYVILDHGINESGQSVMTLYAHCSSIVVSEGQEVSKGQHIANVGSTGWSTGPHLHFEVRLNGSPVNPAGYIGA